jgi:alcohol dehydrogenase class IV
VHLVGAADRLRRGLRQAEVADLALLHELGHRAHRLLDRHGLVDAVLVVEVDLVHAEALERGLARAAHVLRLAVDADPAAVLPALVAELRRQHDLVAAVGDRAADEQLVGERPVHVGGVQEVHAELDRAVDGGDRLVLVGAPVELGHAHAAEADGRDLQALRP